MRERSCWGADRSMAAEDLEVEFSRTEETARAKEDAPADLIVHAEDGTVEEERTV
jgi:hypothetical protein